MDAAKAARKRQRKTRNVVRAVHETAWAIRPEKLIEIKEFLDQRNAGVIINREDIAAKFSPVSAPVSKTIVQNATTGGQAIALISVHGTLAPRMNLLMEFSGGTSYSQLTKAFRDAESNESVQTIVFEFDSPGGAVSGLEELHDEIKASSKETIALVNHQCASAAYHLAVACDEIVMTPSGLVGSVGVLMLHTDTTAAQEKTGVKTNIYRVPENKAEGTAGEAMSDEAEAAVMNIIGAFYTTFLKNVTDGRTVSESTVRTEYGRIYGAEEALRLKMVDRIATRSQLLTELGAESVGNSPTARANKPFLSLGELTMNKDVFAGLHRLGMISIEADEPTCEAALEKFYAVVDKDKPSEDAEIVTDLKAYLDKQRSTTTQTTATAVASPPADPPATKPAANVVTGDAKCHQIPQSDESRTAQIIAAVRLASLPDDVDRMAMASEYIAAKDSNGNPLPVEAVLEKLQGKVAESAKPAGPTKIEFGDSERDKFFVAARDACLIRTFSGSEPEQIWSNREQDFVDWSPAPGSRNNRHLRSLPRLAEECLILEGFDREQVSRLSNHDVACLAMGVIDPQSVGIYASADGPSYNLTGMFSNVLLDASNVMLRRAYTEAPTTFEMWARQADSLPDFKDVHKVAGGELPDPKAIPEDGEFEESTYTDTKEKYHLVVWGEVFSISWQAVVNDQLGEFTSVPQKQGRAMRRKQNKLVYGVLTDNPKLASKTTLFHADHSNNTTGAVTDYTAAWNTMEQKMAEQSGLTSGTTLNLEPRYVLHPPALKGDILKELRSSGQVQGGHSGVENIWAGRLTPVSDAQLGTVGGGTNTNFFLVADNADVDTVEYAYLQGLETPRLENERAFDRLGMRFRIYQAFATAPIDFRGLQRHTGAA